MVFSIIGGSGSGKDTQAAFLAEKYNIPHISMGQIMRDGERAGHPLAIEAQKFANMGRWVPDEITSALLQEFLEKNAKEGFVLTGYPRPVEQIRSFDRILHEMGLKLTAVIHIDVADEVLLARMRKQVEDMKKTGDTRSDVSEDAMLGRLKAYHETIEPLLAEYIQRNILINIDGAPSIEEVRDSLFKAVEERVSGNGSNSAASAE
jgi:adenylate kinase